MQLHNRSSRDSIALASLCEFVVDNYRHSEKVYLDVVDQEEGKESGGFADKEHGQKGCPSRVTIWATKDRHFPTTNSFEGFKSKLYDWKEEFILVLAHELRHIDQFWTKVPKEYEYDAEKFAVNILSKYRRYRKKYDD